MILLLLLFTLISPMDQTVPVNKQQLGGWELSRPDGTQGQLIMVDDFFSITYYKKDNPEFISTEGGKWEMASDGKITFRWEYNTQNPKQVGQQTSLPFSLQQNTMRIADNTWRRVDNGSPGQLNGAWLITGREQNGEMGTMTPGARKTMKILSGTRFQWIAYNSETGEFFGTGGGTYTTKDGKYTENILFFSRDNSRVGASLEFNYALKDGKWHHSGHSSKGDPIYEIWTTRQSLGI